MSFKDLDIKLSYISCGDENIRLLLESTQNIAGIFQHTSFANLKDKYSSFQQMRKSVLRMCKLWATEFLPLICWRIRTINGQRLLATSTLRCRYGTCPSCGRME